jgi:predicted DsbA family dithiol-disulfide isomerase
MNIDIWSDIACPWCFIGKRRFERALAGFPHREDVTVTWHSFQLDPTLPEHYEGTELEYLATRKSMARDQVSQMFDQVTQVAAGEGLAYDFDSVIVANSLRGHQLLQLAAEHGAADAVKEALLSAHFEHGEDIGSTDVLSRIGVAAGLEADAIRVALETERYLPEVRADIERARRLGIQGVPFFVVNDKYGISGAQPVEVFTQALEQAWREANPLVMVGPVSSEAGRPASGDAGVCGPDGCAI